MVTAVTVNNNFFICFRPCLPGTCLTSTRSLMKLRVTPPRTLKPKCECLLLSGCVNDKLLYYHKFQSASFTHLLLCFTVFTQTHPALLSPSCTVNERNHPHRHKQDSPWSSCGHEADTLKCIFFFFVWLIFLRWNDLRLPAVFRHHFIYCCACLLY